MTLIQKNITKDMREGGKSYAEIADWLGLSKNTVKSYCQRNNLHQVKKQAQTVHIANNVDKKWRSSPDGS